ncbi:TetR/AcrR family transcriptional regulator [Gordonia phthalatica]|uniref:TetR family transcriptional regulator n=1 Tax=Gordonia phthalatica TaxID=1136941 RepID=A0A0N9N7J6_9ACTN|nr:TetR family transcriptional regulator [Gordonia phthalatica]ALG83995.1 TetR family transcriptional regulator [Gordonia phthalatica]
MTDNSTAAAPGSTPGPRPGLRERQKAQTRADIRAAALALFTEHGYEATTVAQIADAANVSHTTFFRYFQSKEQVITNDDLDEQREAMLSGIPRGLGHFDLIRELITQMYQLALDDPWASDPERYRILHTEPALRAVYQLESDRVISEATEFLADYLGVDPKNPRLQVFVAAVSGVMFHLSDDGDLNQIPLERFLDALDMMEAGFPLP